MVEESRGDDSHRRRGQQLSIGIGAGVAVLALVMRGWGLGQNHAYVDEARIMISAMRFVQDGVVPLLGPPMSIGFFHSPVTHWIYAVGYALGGSLVSMRWVTAGLAALATGVMAYYGAWRYHWLAGLVGGVLYATHLAAVATTTQVNNAQLAPLFVALTWVLGVMGFLEDQRWARAGHALTLAIAIQLHPHLGALSVASVVVVSVWLWRTRERFWWDVLELAVLAAAAALTFVPWIVGLLDYGGGRIPLPDGGGMNPATLGHVWQVVYSSLSSDYFRGANWTSVVAPALMVAGVAWLAVRVWRGEGNQRWVDAMLLLDVISIPVLVIVLRVTLIPSYFWPMMVLIMLVIGVVAGDAARWVFAVLNGRSRVTAWGAAVVMGLALGMVLQRQAADTLSRPQPIESPPLATYQSLVDTVRSTAAGRPVLLIAGNNDERFQFFEVRRLWADDLDIRTVRWGTGLPMPEVGGLAVVGRDDASLDDRLMNRQAVLAYFALADLPAGDDLTLTRTSYPPLRLENGAVLEGVWFDAPPQPGAVWTVDVMWRVADVAPAEATLFVQLLGMNDEKYAQADVVALPIGSQRIGERVLNRVTLALPPDLPVDEPLYLRYGMVVDGATLASVEYVADARLLIGDAAAAVADLGDGWLLEEITTNSPFEQGPPIVVQARWFVPEASERWPDVCWAVTDDSGAVAYAAEMALSTLGDRPGGPGYVTSDYLLRIAPDWPVGRYGLQVGLCGRDGVDLTTTVEVRPRAREFREIELGGGVADVGNDVRLLSGASSNAGGVLTVTLAWQSLAAQLPDRVRFVHVLDANGQVVAQADGEPLGGAYPMSWWARGEVVTETVVIDISGLTAGTYQLGVGWYDPLTFERVSVVQGGVARDERNIDLGVIRAP